MKIHITFWVKWTYHRLLCHKQYRKGKRNTKVRNPKKPMVNMIHMNLTYYNGIIIYILNDFVALQKSGILFRILPVNSLFYEVTFFPVMQFIISDWTGANTLNVIYSGHTKGIKWLSRDCYCLKIKADDDLHRCNCFK